MTDRQCLHCKKALTSRQKKFCSKSCSASIGNRSCRRRGEQPGDCLLCKKQLPEVAAQYCSRQCYNEHKRLLRYTAIQTAGEIHRPKIARWYLVVTFGHQCALCKITTWMGEPVPLVLDHINGHAEDGSLRNLRMICPNCDALLPTYKARNKGNGRASRRQRYAEGKSY